MRLIQAHIAPPGLAGVVSALFAFASRAAAPTPSGGASRSTVVTANDIYRVQERTIASCLAAATRARLLRRGLGMRRRADARARGYSARVAGQHCPAFQEILPQSQKAVVGSTIIINERCGYCNEAAREARPAAGAGSPHAGGAGASAGAAPPAARRRRITCSSTVLTILRFLFPP